MTTKKLQGKEEPKQLSLEELLGQMISVMDAQTIMLRELMERIPPKTKLNLLDDSTHPS